MFWRLTLAFFGIGMSALSVQGADRIRLPNHPSLSPDGLLLTFDWEGDIWIAKSTGGLARPLTQHPARDRQPEFSPDGKFIAFISDREAGSQVFVMPVEGGAAKQVTFNTSGYLLHGWTPEGKLLVSSQRDHHWRNAERMFVIDPTARKAEEMLFDDYGTDGSLSPDGKKLLFSREGHQWWRKGYRGSQASQIWLYDRDSKKFTPIVKEEWDARYPLWKPDGTGFYYVSGRGGVQNLYEKNLQTGADKILTSSKDDSVVFPTLSRNGAVMVYRQLFDFYRLQPGVDPAPTKIELFAEADRPEKSVERKTLESATAVAFSDDALEIAFIAGGDLWVMDTELREPKQITKTPQDEREPVFSSDHSTIYFIAEMAGGQQQVMKATRKDKTKGFFLNDNFDIQAITKDGEVKSGLSISPDGSKLAVIRGRGDLWVMDLNGQNEKRIIQSWNAPSYDWSPDGKWFVYALFDNDFNRDIFIQPLDGSKPAYNLSRHPYNDSDPVWSPDGKMIAFVGAREDKDNVDIHYVYLRLEDEEKGSRERTIEKAIEKFQKGRTTRDPSAAFPPRKLNNDVEEAQQNEPAPQPREEKKDAKKEEPKKEEVKKDEPKRKTPEVVIDFEKLADRVRRVTIANSSERGLLFSPDSKKLAFAGSADGQPGFFTIEFPDNLRPTSISSSAGSQARWLRNGSIAWLVSGVPALFSPGSGSSAAASTPSPTLPASLAARLGSRGGATSSSAAPGSFRFTAYQEVDLPKRHQAAFELAWTTMRDNWYDERMGNRNWAAIREKYLPAAESADAETVGVVIQLMLGELNGSHLGFTAGGAGPRRGAATTTEEPTGRGWNKTTANLGIRFVHDYAGPGLKIRDIIPNGPADQKKYRLVAGEIVTQIDGKPVNPQMDLTLVLNGIPGREVAVTVKAADGKERTLNIRPSSNTAMRPLLYQAWMDQNRKKVEEWSKGRLGYLHIQGMDMPSFYRFEEALYAAGAGKEGMVIDVRENGGGSTADLLLTALTQPKHAIAVPRNGGQGYPQDRTVFATWTKPIIVLCNQNSFSNAEIFSHAIKTLKRGKLVGVPTAGGVISTGGTTIMDVGFLRLPFRGWYKVDDGKDMELNGAVPDILLWPEPGEMPAGIDRQLEKATATLLTDVDGEKAKPQPKLLKATEQR